MSSSTAVRRKAQPLEYAILWAIFADRDLIGTDKAVAAALLLKFRNKITGQCNPSYGKLADVVGMSRDTAMDSVARLEAAGYVTVRGTRGGSASNTNQFDFHPKRTGGASTTGGAAATGGAASTGGAAAAGGASATEGVEQPPHELWLEPSRTNNSDPTETGRPDRSLPRSLTGALRDPEPQRVRPEVLQNRIAMRLSGGWNMFGDLPEAERDRLTELERTGTLSDEALGLAIAAARMGKA